MVSNMLQGQKGLDDSSRVFQWNRLLMSTLGLWPANLSDFLFGINFSYFCYQMILEYLDLFLFIDNLEHVIMNLTENMAFSQIFIRMLMLRVYNRQLGDIIADANKDFDAKNYTEEEIKTFVAYHVKSRTFMKLLIINTAFTASSYYVKPLLGQLGEIIEYVRSDGQNTTLIFMLPYRFYTFYELKDASTYFWTYGSQLPFVFISGFGQSAADCLMVTLVYHISGQMAVLAMRIAKIDTHSSNSTDQLHRVVKAHIRLLRCKFITSKPSGQSMWESRGDIHMDFLYYSCINKYSMGKVIRSAFSATLLGHLIGATSLVCILGYQILASLANGERAILISFFAFIFLVLLVLYAHCTVGESLITESERVSRAYYDCKWYNMSKENARIIILCIARSQQPMQLTAGKFNMFCLATLTDSIKASMGYLSVLRTIM